MGHASSQVLGIYQMIGQLNARVDQLQLTRHVRFIVISLRFRQHRLWSEVQIN